VAAVDEMIPVVFFLDEDGEATGEVWPFCCEACGMYAMSLYSGAFESGQFSREYDSLTQHADKDCVGCGFPLSKKG